MYINFRFPFPWILHVKIGFDCPSGFRGDLFDMLIDVGQTPEHGYTINSHFVPNGSSHKCGLIS